MPTSRPPVLILAEPPTDRTTAPPGWTLRHGFMLPAKPWDLSDRRWMAIGSVDDASSANAAMALVTRGVGLTVHIALEGTRRHAFLEDLHKIAAPEAYVDLDTSGITAMQRDLLDALAGGATVTAAAASLHMSRRTANRLLTEIRCVLGVESTAAAVTRWTDRSVQLP